MKIYFFQNLKNFMNMKISIHFFFSEFSFIILVGESGQQRKKRILKDNGSIGGTPCEGRGIDSCPSREFRRAQCLQQGRSS